MARRVWTGYRLPPDTVLLKARSTLARLRERPGKVESAGSFADPMFVAAIREALPPALAAAVRDQNEWYACRGAFFHTDAHYDGVLFGVWCVLGPPRDVVFARAGVSAPAGVGHLAIFDPYEPHAVLLPGAATYDSTAYEGTAPSLFLGFEVTLTPDVREAFGIEAPRATGPVFSSRLAVNPETGAAATTASA